jgi:serine/threonine-protein kinase
MVWMDRAGRQVGTVGGPGNYDSPALSPDGTQLAVRVLDPAGLKGDVWVWDLARDVGSRLTFTNTDASDPVWSPDGQRILFSAARGARTELFVKPFGGASAESLLFSSDAAKFGDDWSPDGQTVAFIARGQNRRWDVNLLSLAGAPRATPYLASEFSEYGARFSPDGRWLVYTSFESGSEEVYLQAFPGPGGKWRISTQGGSESAWRGDGREIFYLSPDRKLMSVSFEPGAAPRIGLPQKLFDAPVIFERDLRNRYVPTRDGQRFLLLSSRGEAQLGPTTVVLHWTQRLGGK